jgi:hypothetical protein
LGDIVRCSSTFTDTGGVKADPTTVDFVYTTPAGVDTVNTRSSTEALVDSISRTTAGVYFRDVATTSSGTYWYRFSSTGTITTSAEWNFRPVNYKCLGVYRDIPCCVVLLSTGRMVS